MSVTAQTARLALGQALVTYLGDLDVTVYSGEVPEAPPVIRTADGPDSSGRVAAYAVVYGGTGVVDLNASLDASPADLLWGAQVTFAAGYAIDLLDLLDRGIPHLRAWAPSIDGLVVGEMRPPFGTNFGPVRRNDAARPPRFYLPTQWELHVVTA